MVNILHSYYHYIVRYEVSLVTQDEDLKTHSHNSRAITMFLSE
jgi:hypothetical protein